MKDYQQKRMRAYTLPQAVYRQALWAVKDLDRMNQELNMLEDRASYIKAINPGAVMSVSGGMTVGDSTGNSAVNIVYLKTRIEAIEDAFKVLPAKYASSIRNKLVFDIPYPADYCDKTWKKWQQIYIYNVAKNLKLF